VRLPSARGPRRASAHGCSARGRRSDRTCIERSPYRSAPAAIPDPHHQFSAIYRIMGLLPTRAQASQQSVSTVIVIYRKTSSGDKNVRSQVAPDSMHESAAWPLPAELSCRGLAGSGRRLHVEAWHSGQGVIASVAEGTTPPESAIRPSWVPCGTAREDVGWPDSIYSSDTR